MTAINLATKLRVGSQVVNAVHVAERKVFPHPHWYLRPHDGVTAYGSITTVDTPDLTLMGDYRWTAHIRDDSAESAGSRMVAFKGNGAADLSWQFCSTYTNIFYTGLGYPTGATSPQVGFNMGANSRTLYGLTPPGNDIYVGGIIRGIDPASQALTSTSSGLTSTDGITWSVLSINNFPIRADGLSRDSAGPLRIGATYNGSSVWVGRIYWVQLEQINRPGGAPDLLVFRFDANEWPRNPTPLSFTDPRGRTWTLTNANGIHQPLSVPD